MSNPKVDSNPFNQRRNRNQQILRNTSDESARTANLKEVYQKWLDEQNQRMAAKNNQNKAWAEYFGGLAKKFEELSSMDETGTDGQMKTAIFLKKIITEMNALKCSPNDGLLGVRNEIPDSNNWNIQELTTLGNDKVDIPGTIALEHRIKLKEAYESRFVKPNGIKPDHIYEMAKDVWRNVVELSTSTEDYIRRMEDEVAAINARPKMFNDDKLSIPSSITREHFNKLRQAYESRYQITPNARKPDPMYELAKDMSRKNQEMSSSTVDYIRRMEEEVMKVNTKKTITIYDYEMGSPAEFPIAKATPQSIASSSKPTAADGPEVNQCFKNVIDRFQENMIAACSKSLKDSIQLFKAGVKEECETSKFSALNEKSAKMFLSVHQALFEESERFLGEMKLSENANASGDSISFDITDIEGEESGEDSSPGGVLVTNWAPFRQRVSTMQKIKPFSQMDGEARNLLQRKLQLILHAHKCIREQRTSCSVKHCGTYRDVIIHWLSCNHAGTCQRTHCTSTREIMAHWRNCTRSDCLVCQPARLSRKQQFL